MDNTLFSILTSEKSKFNVTLDSAQNNAVQSAMHLYAIRKIDEYRSNESKAINLEAVSLFPALFKGEWKLWLRKRAFIKAKKAAQVRANIEGRPVHVVRSTDIAFIIQSTKEVRQLKKVGIYKKNVDAITMNSVADYTAYPKDTYLKNTKKQFEAADKAGFQDRVQKINKKK